MARSTMVTVKDVPEFDAANSSVHRFSSVLLDLVVVRVAGYGINLLWC